MNINRLRFILLSIVTIGGIAAVATVISIGQTKKESAPEKPAVTVPMVPGAPTPNTDVDIIPPSSSPSIPLTNEQAQMFAEGYVMILNSGSDGITNSNPKGTIEGTWLNTSFDVSDDGGASSSNYLLKYNLVPRDDGIIGVQTFVDGSLQDTNSISGNLRGR